MKRSVFMDIVNTALDRSILNDGEKERVRIAASKMKRAARGIDTTYYKIEAINCPLKEASVWSDYSTTSDPYDVLASFYSHFDSATRYYTNDNNIIKIEED